MMRTTRCRWTVSLVGILLSASVNALPATQAGLVQQAYLKADNAEADDEFGTSVATAGDTVVVGVALEDGSVGGIDPPDTNGAFSSGAVYVFRDAAAAWLQEALLKHPDPDPLDQFGSAVAISGNTLVVGCRGEAGGSSGVGGDPFDNSLPSAGAALVYVRTGTVWTLQGYLKASEPDPNAFGVSVAIAGDTIVVGAPWEGSSATGVNGDATNDDAVLSGAAYVFARSGTTWSQQAYLKASNTGDFDEFGTSVAVSGDTIVVGAWRESSSATGIDGDQSNDDLLWSGAAYVFARQGTAWSQQAYVKASDSSNQAQFGESVAISNDTILVGAIGANSFDGASYVFVRSGTTWSQQARLTASNPDFDFFGDAVALAGDRALVGAPFESSQATGIDGNGNDDSAGQAGAAYLFERSGTNWSQIAYIKASNTGDDDLFGTSVALSDTRMAIGAPEEDSGATTPDGSQGDDSDDVGAAYVFGSPPPPVVYCTAKTSSAGCVAQVSTSDPQDQPVSGASDYFVTASNIQELVNGILFVGLAGPAALPFGGGVLCVQPPLKRGPVLSSGGVNPNGCNGSFSTLVNSGGFPPAGLDPGPGNSGWYQHWYRDPLNGPGLLGTTLSNATKLDFE